MNKEELKNSLAPGEKAADILEYHYGMNGSQLVYQVIVYTCKKFLFFKYISTYKFPFYFTCKKVAEDYLQYIDRFEIDLYTDYDKWGYDRGFSFVLIPKNFKKRHYTYRMESTYIPGSRSKYLHKGEVWNGYVDCVDINHQTNVIYTNKCFSDIETLEQEASKEGTTGNRFSYKLQQVD